MNHRHRDRSPLPLVLLTLLFAIAIGCGAMPPNEATSSTQQQVISCPSGQTLYSATCLSGSPCLVSNAEIRSATPTNNYGTQTSMNMGLVGSPAAQRSALVAFDVSAIPTGATVMSATATFTTNTVAGITTAGTTTVSPNLATWAAGTVTWTSAPSYGLVIASNGNQTTPGATWVVSSGLASTVQTWIGSGSNYGIRLEGGTAHMGLQTSLNGTIAARPRLDVCYTPPAPSGCTDGIKDNLETDVDCGGGSCGACANTKACAVGADCTSGLCYNAVCYRRGGESTLPASACTFAAATPVTPVTFQYGTDSSNVQLCDVYAPPSVTGAQMDVRVVSSGFSGGAKGAQIWIDWASYEVSIGRIAVVCDVRHAASGGVNSGTAEIDDTRCIVRQAAAMASTWGGSVPFKTLGDSAGGNLVILQAWTAALQVLPSGNLTVEPDYTLDADGTCPIAWSSSDASYVSRVVALAPPTDLTVKAHIDAGTQTNMDWYVNCPTGESDPHYFWRAKKLSPIFYIHPGLPPLFIMHGTDDLAVYAEQSAGSGNVPVARTTGLVGTVPEAHLDGVDATVILVTSGVHTPTFYPLATGIYAVANCTAMAF